MDYSIGDFFSSVIKLFALLTPPAALSAFLSGTQTYGGRRKRRTALRTGTAVFIVGTVLYFFGESLFSVFDVFGIIRIKAPRPHGRPHKVSSQAENQLENAGIKTVVSIIGSIGMLYPSRKTRSFIVQKYTPIFYGWFTGRIFATLNIQILTLYHRHIRPIIPRGYPYLF